MDDIALLRRQIRARRAQVSSQNRTRAGQALVSLLSGRLPDVAGKRVGIFCAMREEIDTEPMIRWLWQQRAQVFLPVVIGKGLPLSWLPYAEGMALFPDKMGILVPDYASTPVAMGMMLDYVFTPLVAWDGRGYRIGMGGGFYDRTFADKIGGQSPILIGLAYACQFVQRIDARPWDIALDMMVTPEKVILFNDKDELC